MNFINKYINIINQIEKLSLLKYFFFNSVIVLIMKKILFLGYSNKETAIIDKLKENKKFQIFNTKNKIKLKDLNNINLVISFGYRHIIDKEILKKKKNIINLHISYLPYNKGAHPNFWSWVKNTPKGISIHFISEKIDAGDIIFQKKINFPNNNITFRKSYNILRAELDDLFIRNFNKILLGNFIPKKQKKNGSINFKKNLPKNFNSWDVKISEYLKKKLQ